MGLYKRGNTYCMDFVVNGKRVNRSTGKATKAEALEVERIERDRLLAALKPSTDQCRVTLGLAIDVLHENRWADTADALQVRSRLDVCLEIIGDVPLDQITARTMTELRSTLERTRKSTTVDRFMAHMKTLLRWACYDIEVITRVPKIVVKNERNHRDRVMSKKEEVKILDTLRTTEHERPSHWTDVADLVEVMLDTTIRPIELSRLTWADVNLETKQISLSAKVTKNRRPRVVPLTDRAVSVLSRRRSEHKRPFNYRTDTVSKIFREARDKAGIKDDDLSLYICRHTGVTRLLEKGVSIYLVGQIAGHTTSKMTERYGHLSTQHLHDAIAVLNR